MKCLEKTRKRNASILIKDILAANGDIKKDTLDIAKAFADFFKSFYTDACKILYTISTFGSETFESTDNNIVE